MTPVRLLMDDDDGFEDLLAQITIPACSSSSSTSARSFPVPPHGLPPIANRRLFPPAESTAPSLPFLPCSSLAPASHMLPLAHPPAPPPTIRDPAFSSSAPTSAAPPPSAFLFPAFNHVVSSAEATRSSLRRMPPSLPGSTPSFHHQHLSCVPNSTLSRFPPPVPPPPPPTPLPPYQVAAYNAHSISSSQHRRQKPHPPATNCHPSSQHFSPAKGSSSLPKFIPSLPDRPSFTIPQLLQEWKRLGAEWKNEPSLSNNPLLIFQSLLCELLREVDKEWRLAPVAHPSDFKEEGKLSPAVKAALKEARETAAEEETDSHYRLELQTEVEKKYEETEEELTTLTLLLDQLRIIYKQLMYYLQLPDSPLSPPTPFQSLRVPPSLSSAHLLCFASISHHLALLCCTKYHHKHALYFAHFPLALSTLLPTALLSELPLRNLRLHLLSILSELGHRSRSRSQGIFGEAMVREAMRLREFDGEGSPLLVQSETLEMEGRMMMLAGKMKYVRREEGIEKDMSEEIFDIEQRLKKALGSGRWSERHCELILNSVLHLHLHSPALLLLHHLIHTFPSPSLQRQRLLCALADDTQIMIDGTELLSEEAVVRFDSLKFLTEDCWMRGVREVRKGKWEAGEKLMRLGLLLLRKACECAQREGVDDVKDAEVVPMMEEQLAFVRKRKAESMAEKEDKQKRFHGNGKGKFGKGKKRK